MGTGGPVTSALGNGQIANFVNAVKKNFAFHIHEEVLEYLGQVSLDG